MAPLEQLQQTIDKTVDYLFAVQREDGSWQDHLPSSAVSTGTALVALHVTNRQEYADILQAGVAWLRGAQGPDGGWGDAIEDTGNLNGTSIAVSALNLIDPKGSQQAVEMGLAFIEARGGAAALEDKEKCTLSTICRTFMAEAGLYDPEQLGHIPVELILLPKGLRQKVSFTLPGLLSWGVMRGRTRPSNFIRRTINRIAEPKALAWLDGVQAFEGYQGGFEESPLMVGVVAFGLHKAGVGEAIAERCRQYLLATCRPDGAWSINRDLEFSATMFVVMGLTSVGQAGHPALEPTLEWIRAGQSTNPFFPTGCPAGGWGWSRPSGWPDSDDTSSALMVLPALGVPPDDPQVQRGGQWLLEMQNKNGSWSCFLKGGALTLDKPSPVFTAHALMALVTSGTCQAQSSPISRGIRYFENIQQVDGAIPSIWYKNLTAGTAAVLETCGFLGLADTLLAKKCQRWLLTNQNEDGSWGEWQGKGTVEETSWALSALVMSGLPTSNEQVCQSVAWLCRAQQANGCWLPSLIGVYFSSLYYSSDHIANGYALRALGQYQLKQQGLETPVAAMRRP